jgi:hypothetical protein
LADHAVTGRTIDWVMVHLVLTLFPAALSVTGALAALLALGRARRGIWLYATVSLTLAAIVVIPTYFSGGLATTTVVGPRYTDPALVRMHAHAARIAAVLVIVAGLVAVVVWRRLVRYPRELRLPGVFRTTLLVSALAAAAAVGYSWALGASLVHHPATRGRPIVDQSPPTTP